MINLDNFKSLFYFFFSYFWCQTSSVIRRPLDPDPNSVRILPDPGWFHGSRKSDTKGKKTKKNDLKLSKIFIQYNFKDLPLFKVKIPGSESCKSRILTPGSYPLKKMFVLREIRMTLSHQIVQRTMLLVSMLSVVRSML